MPDNVRKELGLMHIERNLRQQKFLFTRALSSAEQYLEHLRSVCSHVGALVLPPLVSVANVGKVFDEQGRCLDPVIERQVRSVATNLLDYIHGSVCPRITLERMTRDGVAVPEGAGGSGR